ncbi:MAG: Uncharacterised protein [Acidimicrobiales bacterium AG-410-I20]|nr:MAG: Uncharacterised protein [Acidimicrobiales bacterium AG-410-I20]
MSNTSATEEAIDAPTSWYELSSYPAPVPAPDSITTLWPRLVSSLTALGVSPILFSAVFISAGTPISITTLLVKSFA